MKDTPLLSQKRKNEHIQICKTQMVESSGVHELDAINLCPEALPEFNFDDIDTSQMFLNSRFSLPIFITGMTGGVKDGNQINHTLAQVAQKYNIPMGLGSQKMMLFDSQYTPFFDIKKIIQDVFLIGNLGAVTLNHDVSAKNIVEKLIKPLQLNAFALHLNALQECIQPEGQRHFENLFSKIDALVRISPVPIVIKEVGSGISAKTFHKLIETGVSAVDVSGRGGTSWSVIEGMREGNRSQRLGELFRNWGLTTKESLMSCAAVKKQLNSTIEITATGGIRNGLHVAKCLALGATMSGIGLPIFRAVVTPKEGMSPFESAEDELLFFQESLKISMFCSGSKIVNDLKDKV